MNVVTFETAKRLKDVGFPQPETFAKWQFLYSPLGTMCSISTPEQNDKSFTFAPTATDILKELPEYKLSYINNMWFAGDSRINGYCKKNTNPAEACAAAWLAIHEKTGTEAGIK